MLRARIGQRVRVMVRPERFVDLGAGGGATAANRIDGVVAESGYIGVSDKYRIFTPDGLEGLVRLPSGASSRRYGSGEPISAGSTPPMRG
jgi:putative spermidine/putrescine transport system ATP-binding protein